MGRTQQMEQNLEYLKGEHKTLQNNYAMVSKDLTELRKREDEFNNVLSSSLKQQHEIDAVMAQRDKLLIKNENLRGQNQVYDSELTVIKKEILKERQLQSELTKLNERKDEIILELRGKIVDGELEVSDRQQKIDRLIN